MQLAGWQLPWSSEVLRVLDFLCSLHICTVLLVSINYSISALHTDAGLGYGWGNSLLGFLAIAIGVPAPFLFWFYGERLRARSQFAAG
jgi:hypothetical protein